MKKFLTVFLTAILASFSLEAQALGQPVAIVKLETTVVITQKMFHDRLDMITANYGRPLVQSEKDSLLDVMIQEELFRQAAEKAGISATEDDIMRQFRQSNPNMSDEQIHQEAERQYHQPWDKIVVEMKKQMTMQKYLMSKPEAQDLGKNLDVSDAEVSNFFETHQEQFVLPDMVRASYVFFDTKVHPKGTVTEIRSRAEDVLKQIQSGKLTFEEAVRLYSEDSRTAQVNGDMGFIPKDLDSPNLKPFVSLYGRPFLEALFHIKKGEFKLLESNAGIHIVKITDSIERHFLSLDEPVFPGQAMTVRAYIKQNLYREKTMKAESAFVNRMADQLKKKADIQKFPQNM